MNLQIFEKGNMFSFQSNLKWFHEVETYIEILSDDVSDDIGNIMARNSMMQCMDIWLICTNQGLIFIPTQDLSLYVSSK